MSIIKSLNIIHHYVSVIAYFLLISKNKEYKTIHFDKFHSS